MDLAVAVATNRLWVRWYPEVRGATLPRQAQPRSGLCAPQATSRRANPCQLRVAFRARPVIDVMLSVERPESY